MSKPNQANKSNQNKGRSLAPKKDQGKFKRSQNNKKKNGDCYVYGKPGHYAREYRFRKKSEGDTTSKVNSIENNEEIITIVSEINAIHGKEQGW